MIISRVFLSPPPTPPRSWGSNVWSCSHGICIWALARQKPRCRQSVARALCAERHTKAIKILALFGPVVDGGAARCLQIISVRDNERRCCARWAHWCKRSAWASPISCTPFSSVRSTRGIILDGSARREHAEGGITYNNESCAKGRVDHDLNHLSIHILVHCFLLEFFFEWGILYKKSGKNHYPQTERPHKMHANPAHQPSRNHTTSPRTRASSIRNRLAACRNPI